MPRLAHHSVSLKENSTDRILNYLQERMGGIRGTYVPLIAFPSAFVSGGASDMFHFYGRLWTMLVQRQLKLLHLEMKCLDRLTMARLLETRHLRPEQPAYQRLVVRSRVMIFSELWIPRSNLSV
jgi:hypothetical protein